MIITAEGIDPGSELAGDVCIVGAGAAGITLAREMAAGGAKVILLEAGEEEFTDESQDVYDGESLGYAPIYSSRLRYFGGTTNHWSGYCRPYNRIDFEARDWIPRSGWPLPYDTLLGYLEKARPLVEITDRGFLAEEWVDAVGGTLFPLPDTFVQSVSQLSPPTRFAERYRGDLEASDAITCVLRASVVDLEPAGDGGRKLARVTVQRYDDETFTATARFFVLALGGVENARLLLAARAVKDRALGTAPDLIGRFFMDHVGADVGVLAMPMAAAEASVYLPWKGRQLGDTVVVPAIETSDGFQRQHKLTNVNFTLIPGQSYGVRAFRRIAGDLERFEWPRTLDRDIVGMFSNFDDVLSHAGEKLGMSDATMHFYVRAIAESTPNPDSRVTLDGATDRFGLPRARLSFQANAIDLHSVDVSLTALARALGEAGLGRVKTDFDPGGGWSDSVEWGYHHCGTTRMSAVPEDGVVDADLRLHGMENLYVVGSSVFPTIGATTPTWPIAALSLRLADHLRERMSNDS